MESQDQSSEVGNDWDAVRPVLDEAIASLGEEDRNALLLRFFQNETLTSVGAKLGVSEDAAQKRVSRALGKLRELLAGRGINTTASALSIALTAHGVQAAPAGLVASLTAIALTGAASATSTTLLSKLLALTNMKTAILVLALVGGIVALAFQESNTQSKLGEARASTQRLMEEIETLRTANAQVASQTSEMERLRGDAKDVLRLRAEIARLRQEQAALKGTAAQIAAAETNSPPRSNAPPVQITAKFISVPTASLQSFGWSKTTDGTRVLMDDTQVRAMLGDLEKVSGVEMINEPRVTTANDVEAALSATQPVSLGGTNVNVGVSLNVNPHYSTNSMALTLDVGAQFSQVVDNSIQQDESQRALRVTTITNSVALADGQTVLLRGDITGEGRVIGSTNQVAGPRTLLVCVTPHLLHEDGSYHRLEHVIKRKDEKP